MPASWFSSTPYAGGNVNVYLFPCAGGQPTPYLAWQAALGPEVHLRVAVLPGRGVRQGEEPPRDIGSLAGSVVDAVAALADQRFVLFGHSLGALVAFEVARTLRRRGLPAPLSLWVAAAEGPCTRLVRRRLHDLPHGELVRALREYGGTPPELLDDPEMLELLLPSVRSDLALSECYTYTDEPPLDLPIHLLLGDRDPHVDEDRAGGWARETTRPLLRHPYDGDHFFIEPHQAAIAALVAASVGAAP